MKCKNCGINYDDSERVCPMCGTRSGFGKHTSTQHYSSKKNTTYSKNLSSKTIKTNSTSSNTPKTLPNTSNKNKSTSNSKAVKAVVFILLVLFPLLSKADKIMNDVFDINIAETFSSLKNEFTGELLKEEPIYDEIIETSVYEEPADALELFYGEWQVPDSQNGFILNQDQTFTEYYNGQKYAGEYIIFWNDPEQEECYNDIYSSDNYDCYGLYLEYYDDSPFENNENSAYYNVYKQKNKNTSLIIEYYDTDEYTAFTKLEE